MIGYEIEMRGIPEKYEREINNLLWAFIWDGKTNQIKRNICCLPKEKGGMGMVNIKNLIKEKRVKSMNKIITSDPDNWNAIGIFWLTSLDLKFASDIFLCKCSDVKKYRKLEDI